MPIRPDIRNYLILSVLALIIFGCGVPPIDDPIAFVLNTSEEKAIRKVMESPGKYEIQIHYTQIERINGKVRFKDFTFQQNDSAYFYPASTVKFPIAVLALEKVCESKMLGLKTRFYIEGDTLETDFASEVIKIFAVSDNDANNRLFEFLGQDEINTSLENKAVGPVRIAHRLSTENADDITTQPLIIYLNDSTTTLIPPSINAPLNRLKLNGILKGKGYFAEDSLVEEPFNFEFKNYYPLNTQQEVLKRVIFPEVFEENEQFKLGDGERDLLLKAMSQPPRSWGYDPVEYYDSYVKFFMYGDKQDPIPGHVKIFNKVGYAYGTLTDCAYISDRNNNVEFLLSATILVNDNGIFNDDTYEYESVGIPFLAALGRELYQYEINKK